MQKGARPLDAVGLTFVSSPTCIATTMAFHFANGEFMKLQSWLKHERSYGPGAMAGFLLIGGVLGICVGLAGCFWYSYYKHMDGVNKKKAAEAAKAAAAASAPGPAPTEQTILINK